MVDLALSCNAERVCRIVINNPRKKLKELPNQQVSCKYACSEIVATFTS